MMENTEYMPDIDFESGVLHISNLTGFDELDVLLHDVAGKGDIHPLVVRGQIEGDAFSLPLTDKVKGSGWPLVFILRLAGPSREVVYVHAFVNGASGHLVISTVTL